MEGGAIQQKECAMKNKQLPFNARKKIGQNSEREFMELIALMGGTSQSLGTVPAHGDPTPRFCRPHETAEEGFHYSVSPDILFTLPDQPRGFASLALAQRRCSQKNRTDPPNCWGKEDVSASAEPLPTTPRTEEGTAQ